MDSNIFFKWWGVIREFIKYRCENIIFYKWLKYSKCTNIH